MIAAGLIALVAGVDVPIWNHLLPVQLSVVRDEANSYKLYYGGDDLVSINLATSEDGLAWTDWPDNPIITDGQYHATVRFYESHFVGAGTGASPSTGDMHYRMWYSGSACYGIGGWRYAESADGVAWHNRMAVTQTAPLVYSDAVCMTGGIADVAYIPMATNTGTDWKFRIYATVQWTVGMGFEYRVLLAFSANGYEWHGYDPTDVGYATPVFAGSEDAGEFDAAHVMWFRLAKTTRDNDLDEDDNWEVFYSGGAVTPHGKPSGIGRATSTDGFSWTRSVVVVTTEDGVAWRNASVTAGSPIDLDSTHYRGYFLGTNASGPDAPFRLGYFDFEHPPSVDVSDIQTSLLSAIWIVFGVEAAAIAGYLAARTCSKPHSKRHRVNAHTAYGEK